MQHAGSSSLTRDQTQTPCIGSTESWPLDHQGGPSLGPPEFSEFIPIVTSFLFMAESSSIVWLDHISYTHSSTDGDLGSSHFPSLVDVHVQVALLPFSRACARSRVAGSHRGFSCYHLSRSSWLPQWSCLPCPHQQYTGCLPHPHPHLTFSVFLVLNHSSSISLWS